MVDAVTFDPNAAIIDKPYSDKTTWTMRTALVLDLLDSKEFENDPKARAKVFHHIFPDSGLTDKQIRTKRCKLKKKLPKQLSRSPYYNNNDLREHTS